MVEENQVFRISFDRELTIDSEDDLTQFIDVLLSYSDPSEYEVLLE